MRKRQAKLTKCAKTTSETHKICKNDNQNSQNVRKRQAKLTKCAKTTSETDKMCENDNQNSQNGLTNHTKHEHLSTLTPNIAFSSLKFANLSLFSIKRHVLS